MELRHIRYFTAVAEHLHFGNAARQLHVAQPALSVQIKQLEGMLGGELFHRNKQSVSLTEAGRLFYIEAKKILAQTTHAETIARAALKGQLASFEIGYSGSAAFSSGLKRVIDAIKQSGPSIEIRLQELDPATQLDRLQARKIHFGFVTTTRRAPQEDVFFMPLESWPLLLALHGSHPLARKNEIDLADLENEDFIVYASGEDDPGEIFFPVEQGFNPRVSQRVKSGTMLVPMVAAGLGMALIPSSLADLHFGDDVVFRSVTDLTMQLDCSLVFLQSQHEPAIQRALSTIATEFGCTCPKVDDMSSGRPAFM